MIPEGMRDVLPPETGRLRAVEDRAARRASPPTATARCAPRGSSSPRPSSRPDDDTLAAGYRLHDEQGHELMVRTDMTVPVARLAADRCDDEPLPLRFCYVGPEHPPVGAAARPGRRVPAGRRGAARAGLGRGRRRVRHAALRRARGARPPRLHASRSGTVAFQRALVDSLGLARRGPREVPRGARRPRLPAAREHRRQRRRATWRASRRCGASSSSAAARTSSARRASSPATTPWRRPSSASCRVRDLVEDAGFDDAARLRLRPLAGPGLLHRPDLRGLRARRRPAARHAAAATTACSARFDWDIPGVGFAIAVDRAADALDEAGVALAAAPAAARRSSAAWRSRRGRRSCAAPAWPSRRCRRTPTASTPPLLLRRGGSYPLDLADGRELDGGWREIAERPGGRVRIGLACEAGPPPAEVLDLLEAAGLPAASLRGERRAGAAARTTPARGCWRPAPTCSRACDRGALDAGVVGKDLLLERAPRRRRAARPGRLPATTSCCAVAAGRRRPAARPRVATRYPRDRAAPLRRRRRAGRDRSPWTTPALWRRRSASPTASSSCDRRLAPGSPGRRARGARRSWPPAARVSSPRAPRESCCARARRRSSSACGRPWRRR